MSRPYIIALIALVLIIGGGVAYYFLTSPRQDASPNMGPDLTGQSIFSDGEEGFTIRFPESYKTDQTFTTFYHLPPYWRSNADPEATGTPIIALISYRTDSDHSYPRYYTAEVRIGASADPKELARCEVAATEQNEKQLPDTTIGGTVFKTFSFESAGMQQYLKGVSYRIIHEGKCIAIEKLQTGASYRDDPDSPDDISDEVLQAKYNELDKVVETFAFVRP